MQLVSQFCCDSSCALRYRLLESCYTRQRFSVILEAVVSSAAILSWNKTSRAQKEQFDWPMPLSKEGLRCISNVWPNRVIELMFQPIYHVSISPTDGNGPTEGKRKTLTRVGIEPTTFGFDHLCSTD